MYIYRLYVKHRSTTFKCQYRLSLEHWPLIIIALTLRTVKCWYRGLLGRTHNVIIKTRHIQHVKMACELQTCTVLGTASDQ